MINKKAITNTSKAIIVGQLVLVIGFFTFVIFYTPKLDYPRNGETLNQNAVEFKFRNANVILIDDNSDFSSPREINLAEANISRITFKPGTYYWKAAGIVESSPREFTINSNVGLELNEENQTLKNVGDTTLNVSVKNKDGLSGLVILGVEIEYPVETENGTIYQGEQYEK